MAVAVRCVIAHGVAMLRSPVAIAAAVLVVQASAIAVVLGVAACGPPPPAAAPAALAPGPHRLRATMSGYYPVQEMKIVVERDTPATHIIALVTSH